MPSTVMTARDRKRESREKRRKEPIPDSSDPLNGVNYTQDRSCLRVSQKHAVLIPEPS